MDIVFEPCAKMSRVKNRTNSDMTAFENTEHIQHTAECEEEKL